MLRSASVLALLVASNAIAQCTIAGPGTALSPLPIDAWSAIQPIGFAFPFAGSTYTDMYITDHGMIALSNAGTPAVPAGGSFVWDPATAKLVQNGPVIAPYWSDHTGGTAGTIKIDNTSGTHCTVTWVDHQTYFNQTPAFTVQVTLHLSGQIVMCLDNRVNNSGSTFGALNAIIGVSPGTPAVLPAPLDISTSPVTADNTFFEEWVTTAASTPNPLFDVANSTITLIPTGPGWVILKDTLACAASTPFGTGCDGLSLSATPPVLGTNWVLTTSGIQAVSPIAITFFGTGEVNPGLPLTSIGINAPGCNVHVSGLITSLDAPNLSGTANLSIPLPLSAALKNASLVAQSLSLTLNNPASINTSNGLTGDLGF